MKWVDAETPIRMLRKAWRKESHRRQGGQGILKRSNFHGPRSLEQSLGDLRGEQSEQHEQQPADGIAATVVRVQDQLRSRRCSRPFAGERAGGEPDGIDAI